MSTRPPKTTDQDQLAAEYALGVLAADEHARARELERADADFRALVARWRGRLAPLMDEIPAVSAPSSLWARIEQRLGGAANDNDAALRRRVTLWQGITGAMTAIAAALALVLVQQPRSVPAPVPVERPSAPPMVALLGDEAQKMKVVASWDPASRQLVLAVAGDMPADPNHAHELWVIPADGTPRSLGVMPSDKRMHMRLADALARLLQQGATIAISVEPSGGSPTGQPTGPVVAAGPLDKA